MDRTSDAAIARRFVRRIAEALSRRNDAADLRRVLLQRATTDGILDRKLFIEVLIALDSIDSEPESNS